MIDFNDVIDILSKHGGVYFGNNIPEKKLRNARIYMDIPNNEKIYALYDSTFFGSAKEGTCFTEKKIYGRTSSGVDSITYDSLAKSNITFDGSLIRVNGSIPSYAIGVSKLIVEIHNLGAPISLTDAKKALYNEGNYQKCIELLNEQECRAKNTTIEDMIIYRSLYIEAYMLLKNIDKAESLLNTYKQTYGSYDTASTYIKEVEDRITNFRKEYEDDLNSLNAALLSASECTEDCYEEALNTLYSKVLRTDFPSNIKKKYYDIRVSIEILAEKPDDAETSIDEAFDSSIISDSERDDYVRKVEKLRETLHERYVQEQRELLAKNIEMAKMYEKHGILESASDTINAAISAAPVELANEKTEAFKTLVELLVSQYEYEQIYELRNFYSSISKDELLGYNLYDLVEKHRSEHIEEYYAHLYDKAIYYMQTGKFEEAHKYIEDAKSVKCTFDVRCAEINLAILELNYLESRELLDALIQDKSIFADNSDYDASIEHFEKQYSDMIDAISTMLKVYAITDNVDGAMENSGYDGYKDSNGLTITSIASLFTNHNIIDSLIENGHNCEFYRTSDGFGMAFLAAMQMDFSAFSNFIKRRIEGYNTYNCIINEKLDVNYALTDKIEAFCNSENISSDEATEKAIKELYNECVLFYICLLNEGCYDSVCATLEKTKEKQITLVEKMKEELPEILAKIDDECNEKCNHLREAVDSIKSLLLDVPESREEKAGTVASELADAVGSAVEFANKNAQIMKNEKEWAVNVNSQYIDKIQEKIDVWKSINRDAVKELFDIPSAAINFGEYDESNKQISLSLANCSTKTTMSPSIISLLTEHPEQVMIEPNVEFEYDDGKEFKAVHKYSYSVDDDKCIVEFVNVAQLDGSESVVDKLVNIILPNKEA